MGTTQVQEGQNTQAKLRKSYMIRILLMEIFFYFFFKLSVRFFWGEIGTVLDTFSLSFMYRFELYLKCFNSGHEFQFVVFSLFSYFNSWMVHLFQLLETTFFGFYAFFLSPSIIIFYSTNIFLLFKDDLYNHAFLTKILYNHA